MRFIVEVINDQTFAYFETEKKFKEMKREKGKEKTDLSKDCLLESGEYVAVRVK